MATLVDSYSETNTALDMNLYATSYYRRCQSFKASEGGTLDTVKFYCSKGGSPTGSVYAKVWSHSGTYGSSSVADSVLATSDARDISAFATEGSSQLETFSFSGAERITLSADPTPYCVSIEYNAGNSSNYLNVGLDNSSPTHGGNYARYMTIWEAFSAADMPFYVYIADSSGLSVNISPADPAYWVNKPILTP